MIKINVNAKALDIVVDAMAAHSAELDRLAGMEAETLRLLEMDNRGPWAMADARAKFETQRKDAAQRMQALVAEQKAAYFADVDRQSIPDGGQINSGDYELLRGELVSTPEELTALQDRYAHNPAMRRAIARYAIAHKWDGFSDLTDAAAVRAFGEQFFGMAAHGAENPNSYNGMLIADKQAVSRMIRDAGLFMAEYRGQ